MIYIPGTNHEFIDLCFECGIRDSCDFVKKLSDEAFKNSAEGQKLISLLNCLVATSKNEPARVYARSIREG